MLFFKKKQKQEKNDKEYSLQEILSITKSAKDENEKQMKKAQSECYKKIDAKILRAAKRGENRIVAISHDGFDNFVTSDFLEEVVRVYNANKAEIMQPFNDEQYHKWVRISWE